jgi:hypothetical protein
VNSLKYLPWRSLCWVAILAVITLKVVDFVLGQSLLYPGSAFLNLLITPAGSMLLLLCEGLALGACGVLYLERWGRTGPIYASVLWALAFCLLISLWLASYLPISGLGLEKISEYQVMSLIVGVFLRGRSYWR